MRSFQFFSLSIAIVGTLSLGILALVLKDISNLSLFFKSHEDGGEEYLSFNLAMGIEEYNWIVSKSNDSSVLTCIALDGTVCQCFNYQTLLSFRIQEKFLSPNCRISTTSSQRLAWKRNSNVPHYISLFMEASDARLSSTPYTLVEMSSAGVEEKVTLVLPLALADLERASVLFESLVKVDDRFIYKMLIIVPDRDILLIESSLRSFSFSFSVEVVAESQLLRRPPHLWSNQLPYATQMAIKLLVATIVETDFYLTLDADHVCLHSSPLQHLLRANPSHNPREAVQAVYHQEDYSVHAFWWEGSQKLLGLSRIEPEKLSFGVTPAVLSTWGSLVTLSLLAQSLLAKMGQRASCGLERECVGVGIGGDSYAAVEEEWLDFLGREGHIWTEYTLYRLALQEIAVFEELHFPEHSQIFLHCENVWFSEQLPWLAARAMRNRSCLFSVVQSSTGLSPSLLRETLRTVDVHSYLQEYKEDHQG